MIFTLGDANGSIPTTEPVIGRPMFGALASALNKSCMVFVSQSSIDNGTVEKYRLKKKVEPVKNCRGISKKDMKLNDALPAISVDPETYDVTSDGILVTCEPVNKLPLTQSVYLF
jgi:urease